MVAETITSDEEFLMESAKMLDRLRLQIEEHHPAVPTIAHTVALMMAINDAGDTLVADAIAILTKVKGESNA